MIDKLLLQLPDKSIACKEARDWAQGKPWQQIFTTCHRGDWLLWLFKKTTISNEDNLKLLIRAKVHCALTVRHLMKDKRSIDACEIALKFADGLATRKELTAAYAAAASAANAAANAAYAAATAAATAAAYAATAAAYAANATAAAYAANAAANAAYAARIKNQQETADICRKYLPIEVWNIVED
jgi:hypothetical protein